jgi:eukaryotic-like serine/threonine-protein kinase
MVGNVYEWVVSVLGPEDERVIRGGSYYFDAMTNRLENREPVDPTLRDINLGVRICADLQDR